MSVLSGHYENLSWLLKTIVKEDLRQLIFKPDDEEFDEVYDERD